MGYSKGQLLIHKWADQTVVVVCESPYGNKQTRFEEFPLKM